MAIKPNIKHKSHYNQKISNPSQKLIYSEVLLNPIWHKGLQSFIWAWCSLKFNLPCILEIYYGNISNVTHASQWVPDNWTKLTNNHTKYKRLTLLWSCHQVSTGQSDLYQMNFKKKKKWDFRAFRISELHLDYQEFRNKRNREFWFKMAEWRKMLSSPSPWSKTIKKQILSSVTKPGEVPVTNENNEEFLNDLKQAKPIGCKN